MEIIERSHHSMDVFPDSGRVLPFGSGATIMYNYIDLKAKNTSSFPLQLKIWMTESHLKGQVVSNVPSREKYHIFEKDHYFIKRGEKYFRYNEIYREITMDGQTSGVELIARNFAPILYEFDEKYLANNGYAMINFTDAY
jgi:vancomycin resistance protein VanW